MTTHHNTGRRLEATNTDEIERRRNTAKISCFSTFVEQLVYIYIFSFLTLVSIFCICHALVNKVVCVKRSCRCLAVENQAEYTYCERTSLQTTYVSNTDRLSASYTYITVKAIWLMSQQGKRP